MNATDIITRITGDLGLHVDAMTAADWQRVLAGLEDGEALAELGITDNDQEAVEEAHATAIATITNKRAAAAAAGLAID